MSHGSGRFIVMQMVFGVSQFPGMVLEVLVYSPFNHLTWLLA
jgi:hypothetical protein